MNKIITKTDSGYDLKCVLHSQYRTDLMISNVFRTASTALYIQELEVVRLVPVRRDTICTTIFFEDQVNFLQTLRSVIRK